ncbi:MAG: MoaD/ThiS family protein [Methanobacteriota archaeon]|nr:MAG: MoaD/ThiS family protein [Euryarchaeota archaeon]
MLVTVHLLPIRRETKALELRDAATVEELIRTLGLLPDGWIAVSDGEPVPIDHVLSDGDVVKLVSVVSGG